MSQPTLKLYYEQKDLHETEVTILSVEGQQVVTDRTVCFAEGGGQVGDQGFLGDLRIVDTKKRGGRLVLRDDLPSVNVETEVVHEVEGDLSGIAPGDRVAMKIDVPRRLACSRLHSAVHLVMGQVNKIFGKESYLVKGCRIAPDRARIDFATDNRLGGDVLKKIKEGLAAWVESDAKVEMRPVEEVPEMFIWHCEADPEMLDQPCGGTHVSRLGQIGPVRLKRSREGKGLERIYVGLENPD